jgi:hypothetical protein
VEASKFQVVRLICEIRFPGTPLHLSYGPVVAHELLPEFEAGGIDNDGNITMVNTSKARTLRIANSSAILDWERSTDVPSFRAEAKRTFELLRERYKLDLLTRIGLRQHYVAEAGADFDRAKQRFETVFLERAAEGLAGTVEISDVGLILDFQCDAWKGRITAGPMRREQLLRDFLRSGEYPALGALTYYLADVDIGSLEHRPDQVSEFITAASGKGRQIVGALYAPI